MKKQHHDDRLMNFFNIERKLMALNHGTLDQYHKSLNDFEKEIVMKVNNALIQQLLFHYYQHIKNLKSEDLKDYHSHIINQLFT